MLEKMKFMDRNGGANVYSWVIFIGLLQDDIDMLAPYQVSRDTLMYPFCVTSQSIRRKDKGTNIFPETQKYLNFYLHFASHGNTVNAPRTCHT